MVPIDSEFYAWTTTKQEQEKFEQENTKNKKNPNKKNLNTVIPDL